MHADFINYLRIHFSFLFNSAPNTKSIYLVSHFLFKDANMLLHTLLLELEQQFSKRKQLPAHFCVQMDKGPENSNRVTIAMMAVLVARCVFKSILITFSSNGHSHNDQDGVFSVVFGYLIDQSIFTPQQLIDLINLSLSSNNSEGPHCHYVDMVVDFERFLDGCVVDFTRYSCFLYHVL